MTPEELARYYKKLYSLANIDRASFDAYKKELADYIMPLKKPIPDMADLIKELNFRPTMPLSPPLRRGNFKFHGDAPIEIVGSEGVDDTNYPHKLTWKLSCGCRAEIGLPKMMQVMGGQRLMTLRDEAVPAAVEEYLTTKYGSHVCRAEVIQF